MAHVSTRSNMPDGQHWVIISFSSIHIPGDERSRTNPGHGYPAHNQPVMNYEAFTDRDEWEARVNELESRPSHSGQYIAGYFTPATIEKVVRIKGMD